MSLDVDLMVTKPCSVFTQNITHNLGKMAGNVVFEDGLTLYDILWRPDEHGFVYAKGIADYLDIGFNILLSEPEHFKTFNPENGWGSYEGLLNFVYNYRNACWDNPEAELSISR
jgi:hypothetical protein